MSYNPNGEHRTQTQQSGSHASHKLQENMRELTDAARETMNDAKDTAKKLMNNAQEEAKHLLDNSEEYIKEVKTYVEKNPGKSILTALAAGLVLGLLLKK